MAKSLTSQLGLGLAVKQNTPVSPIVVNTPPPSKLDQIRAVNQSKQSLNSLVSGLGSDITAIESGDPNAKISSVGAGNTGATTVGELSRSIASPTGSASTAITTPTTGGVVINKNSASGSTAPGVAPNGLRTETVKNYNSPVTPSVAPIANLPVQPITTVSQKPLSLIQLRDKIKMETPNLSNFQATQEARKQFDVQRSVLGTPVQPNEAKTGIKPLDAELAKLREEKASKIKETYKNYALNQADYQKNAGYYTNFGATNDTFNKVLGDIQNTLTNSNQPTLSEQQMQYIASKNGVTVDEIKNPLNIYKNLEMTEEGKQTLGITNRENEMTDLQTQNERAKQDAKTQLDRNTQQLNYQVEDAQKQLRRNLDWGNASGAWSGAGRSSGYEQGMDNMKNDTATIVNRINQSIDNMNTDNSQYLTRLQEDFTKNMTRSKTALDMDVKNLKFDAGLKLNGLEEKYGKGSKDLLKALDSIQEEFGTKSLDSFNKYLSSVKSIQGITMDNINLVEKMNTVTSALKNKRYGELTANNGALLQNISLSSIADEVKAGNMDMGKYADTRNLMISTVTSALQKAGKAVTQDDLNVITNLIDNGATPAQAIARITGGGTLAPTTGLPSLLNMISNAEGTHGNYDGMYGAGAQKDVNLTGMTVKEVQDLQKKRIYQDKNGNWVGGAMGKYQVVSGTLNGLIQRGVVKPTDLFDEATQDKIAMSLMGNSWTDYQTGKITPEAFQRKLSKIWASVPDPSTGQSTYASDGTNAVTKGGGEIGDFLRSGGALATATGGKVYTPTEKAVMDDYLKNPSDAKNIASLKNNNLTANDVNSYMTPTANNGDLTKDMDLRTARLATSIYGKTASDNESKRLARVIGNNPNASDNDIIDAAMGFTIDPKYKTVSDNLRNIIFQNPDVDPKTVLTPMGRLLEQGNVVGAMNQAETSALNVAKKNNPGYDGSEAGVIFATKNANNILDLMNKYEDKFGTISGKWEDYTKGFFGDKEAQKLATSITQAISTMRKDLVGSNITAGEKSALENLIPRLDESVETAREKVMNLKSSPLAQYNSLRESVGLPTIDEGTLTNREKRAELYKGTTQGTTMTPVTTNINTGTNALRSYITNLRK